MSNENITIDTLKQIPDLYNKFYNYLMVQTIGVLIIQIILLLICIYFLYKIFYNKNEKRLYTVEEIFDAHWQTQSLLMILIPVFFCLLFWFLPNAIINVVELNIIPEVKVTSYILDYFHK